MSVGGRGREIPRSHLYKISSFPRGSAMWTPSPPLCPFLENCPLLSRPIASDHYFIRTTLDEMNRYNLPPAKHALFPNLADRPLGMDMDVNLPHIHSGRPLSRAMPCPPPLLDGLRVPCHPQSSSDFSLLNEMRDLGPPFLCPVHERMLKDPLHEPHFLIHFCLRCRCLLSVVKHWLAQHKPEMMHKRWTLPSSSLARILDEFNHRAERSRVSRPLPLPSPSPNPT